MTQSGIGMMRSGTGMIQSNAGMTPAGAGMMQSGTGMMRLACHASNDFVVAGVGVVNRVAVRCVRHMEVCQPLERLCREDTTKLMPSNCQCKAETCDQVFQLRFLKGHIWRQQLR